MRLEGDDDGGRPRPLLRGRTSTSSSSSSPSLSSYLGEGVGPRLERRMDESRFPYGDEADAALSPRVDRLGVDDILIGEEDSTNKD